MSVLTTTQIADVLRISQRAVQDVISRNNIAAVGKVGKAGLYELQQFERHYPSLTKILSSVNITVEHDKVRGLRSDAGKPRGKNVELVEWCTECAMNEFLSDADALTYSASTRTWKPKGVRSACERAVRKMNYHYSHKSLGVDCTESEVKAITSDWLYFNWVFRRDSESVGNKQRFIGAYWRENWEGKWADTFNKHNRALATPGISYQFWKIVESDFSCGQGNGFARFVFLDDRVSKVNVNVVQLDGSLKQEKVTCIVARCLLTGTPLWIEPVETHVNAQHYIRTILNVVLRHGCDRTVWFLENSKSAIANRLTSFIQSLYTSEELEYFKREEHRKLFNGSDCIVRNVPGLPHSIGKAIGERLNKEMRVADGLLFNTAFVGTDRADAIQLERSNQPVRSESLSVSAEEYYKAISGYLMSEDMSRTRDGLKQWARTKGTAPTRNAMREYYSPVSYKIPNDAQLVMLLYYAQEPKTISRAKLSAVGAITVTRSGERYNLQADELWNPALSRTEKLACIELPWRKGYWAVYSEWNKQVQFICIAQNVTATNAEEAHAMRLNVRAIRERNSCTAEKRTETLQQAKILAGERRAIAAAYTLTEQTTDGNINVLTESVNNNVVVDEVEYNEVIQDYTDEDIDNLLDTL